MGRDVMRCVVLGVVDGCDVMLEVGELHLFSPFWVERGVWDVERRGECE